MSKVSAYIGIGANLGDARHSVSSALRELGEMPKTCVTAQSSLYRTAPIDADGDDYINAVARIDTLLTPEELLNALRSIELSHGRERSHVNAPRTLDLDVLLYGSEIIETETLSVPHPRMTQRAFVLIPLLQIDPQIDIPGRGPAHEFVSGVAEQAIWKI